MVDVYYAFQFEKIVLRLVSLLFDTNTKVLQPSSICPFVHLSMYDDDEEDDGKGGTVPRVSPFNFFFFFFLFLFFIFLFLFLLLSEFPRIFACPLYEYCIQQNHHD